VQQEWAQQFERVAREDLVMFINACLACTRQREFYDDAYGQRVSSDFLPDYIIIILQKRSFEKTGNWNISKPIAFPKRKPKEPISSNNLQRINGI